MYMLAEGTGGFVINNTNDMIGGMQKIGKEQNSYYIVGYTPPESAEGSCHTLKVKVDKGGTTVRSRAGYCNVKSHDALAGNPIEKTLESRAAAPAAARSRRRCARRSFIRGRTRRAWRWPSRFRRTPSSSRR